MRTIALVLVLLLASPATAAEPPLTAAAQLKKLPWAEWSWGLWGAVVIAQGVVLSIPGFAFMGLAYDNAQLPRNFQSRAGDDYQLIGGICLGFAVAAIATAVAMFVYQTRGTWHEDAYWQSR